MAGSRFFVSSDRLKNRRLSRVLKQKHVLTHIANVNVREAYRDLYETVMKDLEQEQRALWTMLNDKHHYRFVTSVIFPLPRNKMLHKHLTYLNRLECLITELNDFLYRPYRGNVYSIRNKVISYCTDIAICSDAILQNRIAFNEKDGLKIVLGGMLLAMAVLLFVATLPVSGVVSGVFFGFGVLFALNSVLVLAGFARECVRSTVLPIGAAESAIKIKEIGLPGLRYHPGQEKFELDYEMPAKSTLA